MSRVALLALAGLLLAASPTLARTWYITPDGTGDAPTIQAGVDSSSAGDTLLVATGEYVEQVVDLPHELVVRGASPGDLRPVLDAATGPHFFRDASSPDSLTFVDLRFTGASVAAVFADLARMSFKGCVFERNGVVFDPSTVSGCGIRIRRGSIRVSDCEFLENTDSGILADQYSAGTPDMSVHGSRFVGNVARYGGGIHAWGLSSASLIDDCEFVGNTATIDGGAMRILLHREHVLSVSGCTFRENSAQGSGGAVQSGVYDQSWQTGGRMEFYDCGFFDNHSEAGGGAIGLTNAPEYHLVQGCVLERNQAEYGGGLMVRGTNLTVRGGSVLNSNEAISGGAIWSWGSRIVMGRSTLAFNAAEDAILVFTSNSYWNTDLELARVIIAFSPSGIPVLRVPSAYVTHPYCSNIYGNADGDWVGDLAWWGSNDQNFSADPLFCDPDGGDFTIRSNSPCAPPGATGCGLIGALPVSCGPVSVESESWGRIKGRYR